MKSPYKVNIDRPKVSSEEIFTHRNFRVVLNNYEKASNASSKRKNTWLYFALLLLFFVAAGWLTFSLVNFKMMGEAESQGLPAAPTPQVEVITPIVDSLSGQNNLAIVPPFEELNTSLFSYTVDASKGKKISHEGWSFIQVPPQAFVDEAGNIIEGPVEIQYREFQDAIDVFLAGIPVTYDSSGQQFFWQSAGMIEFKAFADGREVYPNPDNPITVKLSTTASGKAFNLYHFNPEQGWAYEGKDEVLKVRKTISEATGGTIPAKRAQAIKRVESRIDNIKLELKQTNVRLDSLRASVPKAPKKAEKGKHLFNIDVYNGDFPELEVYKNVLFQIGDENEDFKPNLYDVNWDEAYITERVKDVNYNLQLRHRRKKYSFIVYPVLAGRDYEEAMKEYDQKYKNYQYTYTRNMGNEKALHESLEQERERLLKLQETAYIQSSIQEDLYRSFEVTKFGLWNVNQPSTKPKHTVSATFMDSEGSTIKIEQIQLAEVDNNALYIYTPSTFEFFSYNPEVRNIVWGVDNEGKLWVYWPSFFEYVPQDQPTFEFVMEKVDREFENAEEVKAFLGF